MKPPALDEVSAYWKSTQLEGDPAEFYDHFEANGWIVGRVPMKNWQAAARNWSRNEAKFGKVSRETLPRKPQVSQSRRDEIAREMDESRRLRKERGL